MQFWTVSAIISWIVLAGAIALAWRNRKSLGWQIPTYLGVTLGLLAIGATLIALTIVPQGRTLLVGNSAQAIFFSAGSFLLGIAGIGVMLGVIEFALLPALGQFRLGAISRVTYYEALLQPFTMIVLCCGMAAIAITARLSFFTYDEDFKMYRDIASSFVFLFSLPIMVFASTKVIDEEIENRTMLTLMSKPVSRWQVILGKYLGVLLLVLVSIVALGVVAGVCCYLRFYDDKGIDYRVAIGVPAEFARLDMENLKAFYALLPALVLTFLQVATLAAISVAVSTRFGLAVNVTTVVVIYIAANLARYAQMTSDLPAPIAFIANLLTYLLPGLALLDLNQRLVFGDYSLDGPIAGVMPGYGDIWLYVGMAGVYSVFYIGAALAFGMALFRSRELT